MRVHALVLVGPLKTEIKHIYSSGIHTGPSTGLVPLLAAVTLEEIARLYWPFNNRRGLGQKSLRDFIADAFAIKDSEITRESPSLEIPFLRSGAVCYCLVWSRELVAMVYIEIERVERERESFANCAWDNLLYKKKKETEEKGKGKGSWLKR